MTFFTNTDATGAMTSINLDQVVTVVWSEKYIKFYMVWGEDVKFNIENAPEVLDTAWEAVATLGIEYPTEEPEDGEE